MNPNQMNANINPAMNPNQMSQIMNRINAPPNMTAHQAGPIGGHAPQMMNQMAANSPANLPNAPNLMPNQQLPVNINQPTGPPNQIAGPGQMNLNQMLNPMSHIGRNQPPNVYQGLSPTHQRLFSYKVLMESLLCSAKHRPKSTVFPQESKSIGTIANGSHTSQSNGPESSSSAFAASRCHRIAKW